MSNKINWKPVLLDILKVLSGALAGWFATGCVSLHV